MSSTCSRRRLHSSNGSVTPWRSDQVINAPLNRGNASHIPSEVEMGVDDRQIVKCLRVQWVISRVTRTPVYEYRTIPRGV